MDRHSLATTFGGVVRSARRAALAGLAALGLVAASLVAAAPASADSPYNHPMPPGNWTFVRADAYLHYACKIPMSGAYGPVYRIKTATWSNGSNAPSLGIGVYAVTSRHSDATIIDSTTNTGWLYGYNGNELWASAWYADRLWIQGAYYGPARPWTDGFPVAWLTNC